MIFHAGLQKDTVGPDVDVSSRRQIALLPALVRKAQSPRMGSRSELTLRRRYFPSKGIVFNCNKSC